MVVMMKKVNYISALLMVFMAIILSGCALPGVYNHYVPSIEGKVVDADTKEPIEGVLIIAFRDTNIPTIAGSELRDSLPAQEAFTDSEGFYELKEMGNVFADGYINKFAPYLYFFKSGYLVEFRKNDMDLRDHSVHDWYRSSDWDSKAIELKLHGDFDLKYVAGVGNIISSIRRERSRNACKVAGIPNAIRVINAESEKTHLRALIDVNFDDLKNCKKWSEFEREFYK